MLRGRLWARAQRLGRLDAGGRRHDQHVDTSARGTVSITSLRRGDVRALGEVVADISSPADMENWLSRRWMFCDGTPIHTDAHDGIEFTTDGEWYHLDLVDGELVRREGSAGGGKYDLYPNTGWVQVNISRYDGGTIFSYMHFTVKPLKVNMGTGGDGNPPDYVAVAPAAE